MDGQMLLVNQTQPIDWKCRRELLFPGLHYDFSD